MRYRLVIFDLDGTLADSFAWVVDNVNAVADRFGFRRVADDEIEALRLVGPRELLAHLEVPRWKLPRISRHIRQLKAQHDGIGLFPGVDAMLQSLVRQGVATAMVSSDHEENVRRTLGPANVAHIGHFACGASLFGKAAKFRQVMRQAGIGAGDTLAVGDELRDLEAARKAGIAFGAVAWGYANPAVLVAQRPDEFFSVMDDIATRCSPCGAHP
jgi:phosphoglycolate phosphatase